MKPWITLATAPAPGSVPTGDRGIDAGAPWAGAAAGPGQIVLLRRDTEYVIRVDGAELMSSRRHGSEEEMARLASAAIGRPSARVLVGGLGFGYTLRASKAALGPAGRIIVAEISAAVIDWNRTLVGHLAGHPLDDARVEVACVDVRTLIAGARAAFDAILMDVDNGPSPLSVSTNELLWDRAGMAMIARALRPGGALVVWSANADDDFAARLAAAGLTVRTHQARADGGPARPAARPGRGARHTLFVAHRRAD